MVTWNEFRQGVPNRLLLPIPTYVFRVDFVPFEPYSEELVAIKQCIRNAAVDVVRRSEDPSMPALSLPDPDTSLFRLDYADAVRDFVIQFEESAIIIAKRDFSVEDYVVSLPLWDDLSQELFGEGEYSLWRFDFFRPFRTSHSYDQSFLLGPRLSDDSQTVRNIDLMGKFYSRYDDDSAVGWINPDQIKRNNVTISMDKLIGGRPANIWMEVESPHSETGRQMTFRFQLRRGETPKICSIARDDLFEFESIASGFFRDIIVSRVYRNVFNDVSVQSSIA